MTDTDTTAQTKRLLYDMGASIKYLIGLARALIKAAQDYTKK